MERTALVLLAAGSATRMGSPKQLLLYKGKALVRHAAETALASRCSPVIVVVGAESAKVREALYGLDLKLVECTSWPEGMGASIRAGVEAAELHDPDGLVLALADQPLVTAAIPDRLIMAHSATKMPIVASQYWDTVGVPAYFSREFFSDLKSLKPDQGCKGIIIANAAKTVRLPCPEAAFDIDTPADLERLNAL